MSSENKTINEELQPMSSVSEGAAVTSRHTGMKKDLGMVTMVAVGFNICNSWAGLSASTQVALLQGGPATLLFGLIFSTVLYLCIALSMAELASVYSTAGGHLLTAFSWVAIGAAACAIFSQQVLPLAQFYHPDLVLQPWQYFVVYEAFGLVVLIYNLVALKKLPRTHDIGFITTLGLFLTSVVLFITRPTERATNDFVWSTFINVTGWPDAVCFLSAQLTTCFMYAGLDAALHLAEEAENAREAVPRASIVTVMIGFVTAFAYTIALLYSISDFEAVLMLDGYLPFELNRQSYRSDSIAVVILIIGTIVTFFVFNAVLQTSSRITWSLARDDSFVGAQALKQVHAALEAPLWSTVLTWLLVALAGCLRMASSTAFNALLGSVVILQQLSFAIPCGLLLYQKRSPKFLPGNRSFKLPNWLGWMVNGYVVILALILTVFFLLPPFLPASAANMNYSAAILAFIAIVGVMNWYIHGRHHYHGPTVNCLTAYE